MAAMTDKLTLAVKIRAGIEAYKEPRSLRVRTALALVSLANFILPNVKITINVEEQK